MFNNYKIGLILYFSHIISSIILGVFYHIFDKNKQNFTQKQTKMQFFKRENVIGYCINETISSLLIVCSYITIFYLIGEIFDYLKIFDFLSNFINSILDSFTISTKYTKNIFYGILEVTRGVKNLSLFKDNTSVVLASGILSFSSFSIIFQSMNYLKQAKIKTYTFIFSKCMHSILTMILCFLLLKIF